MAETAETYTLTFTNEELRWLWAALDFTQNDIRKRMQDPRLAGTVDLDNHEGLKRYTAMMDRIRALAGQ